MTENNQRQLLKRRNFKNLNAGQIETTITRQQLKNALNTQTGQVAEMLGALDRRLEQMGIMQLPQGTGAQERTFMRNVRENLASIRQQSRATTSIFDLPMSDIPKAIQERMISGFKKSLAGGARSPFTLAAYAGYHGIIMPIPMVIKHAGGLFYMLYCYFFVFVVIFGTRYYYIEYAENERAQLLLNFLYNTFYYLIYPTKMLMNYVVDFTRIAITQAKKNFTNFVPALADGVRGGADMARQAACDNTPFWARWAMGCR